MVDRAGKTTHLRREVRGEGQVGRLGVVARIVGKLDRDRLGEAVRDGSVEFPDRLFRLATLVEADEPDAL